MAESKHHFITGVVTRVSGDLLRYLRRRLGNIADARDVAQETYARLLRVDKVDLIRDPQAYVFRIAANLAYELELNRRREQKRLGEPPLSDDLERLTPLSLEEQTDIAVSIERLNKAMARLPPKCRAALILHRRDGMTYEEIALQIGASVHMVEKYIKIGLQQCRSRLDLLRTKV